MSRSTALKLEELGLTKYQSIAHAPIPETGGCSAVVPDVREIANLSE